MSPSLELKKWSKKHHEAGSFACFLLILVSCLAYSSSLKMEATCYPETSVDFRWTTQRYVTEDKPLHNHPSKNLKSYSSAVIYIFGSLHHNVVRWCAIFWAASVFSMKWLNSGLVLIFIFLDHEAVGNWWIYDRESEQNLGFFSVSVFMVFLWRQPGACKYW
jgi:hypothetical protein